MKKLLSASVLLLLPAVAMAADAAAPDWAYPATPPGYQNPPDNGQPWVKTASSTSRANTTSM
jgi:hypothetical protein